MAVIEHRDLLDRQIIVGDIVACANHNDLLIGTVEKLNPKMIGVRFMGYRSHKNKYPKDMIVVDGPHAMLYLLKNAQ